MAVVFKKPASLSEKKFHYCPGCHHGIIHRLVAQALDELEIAERTIVVASVGCSVFTYDYFDVDAIQAAHGRASAAATGAKRARPDRIVFTYQGDGDLAAIGTAEIVHAAARGENITVIFVNNAIYGMTGGQMAPTTLLGQTTTTTPYGREADKAGYPIQVCELLATLPGTAYLARVSVQNPKRVREAKKAIKEAFQTQIDKKGFSLVEVLSACPTNWRVKPVDCAAWIEKNMIPYYPLGQFKPKNKEADKKC